MSKHEQGWLRRYFLIKLQLEFFFFFSNLHSKNVSLQEILQLSQNSNRSKTKSKYQRPLENFFITPLVPWKFHFFFILPLQFPYANACSVFIQYTPVLKKFHFSTNEPPVWIFSGTDDWPYQSNAQVKVSQSCHAMAWMKSSQKHPYFMLKIQQK